MNEHSVPRPGPLDRVDDIEQRFWCMHRDSREQPPSAVAERKAHLRRLRDVVKQRKREFAEAIAYDFGWRSHDETLMAEVVPALGIIKDALGSLDRWMRPERRARSLNFWPARNRVYWQPKGVVLIIAPWNYPMQLVIAALAAAVAAGNRVIVKPSETAPATAQLIKRHVEEALGHDLVTVATGGVEMAEALCRLPFDHILFTGSTAVGKLVMQAAAQNLTPVTLELGGKSPAIVHGDFDHAVAAQRIARGKLLNAGQTCIAPDYAMVRRDRVEEFVRLYRETVAAFYPRLIDNRDYTSIINERHYQRLAGLVADARAKGARVRDDRSGRRAGARGGRGAGRAQDAARCSLSIRRRTWPSCARRSSGRSCRWCLTTRSKERSPSSMRGRGRWRSTTSTAMAPASTRCCAAPSRAG